jgi:hypothetical protein
LRRSTGISLKLNLLQEDTPFRFQRPHFQQWSNGIVQEQHAVALRNLARARMAAATDDATLDAEDAKKGPRRSLDAKSALPGLQRQSRCLVARREARKRAASMDLLVRADRPAARWPPAAGFERVSHGPDWRDRDDTDLTGDSFC